MLKLIKRLLKDNSLYLAIICTVSIAVLSLIRIEKPVISFSNADKVKHTIAYFTITILWLLALAKTKKQKIIVVIFCFLFGVLMEFLQETVTIYRTAELADILANTIGVITALLIFNTVIKKNNLF